MVAISLWCFTVATINQAILQEFNETLPLMDITIWPTLHDTKEEDEEEKEESVHDLVNPHSNESIYPPNIINIFIIVIVVVMVVTILHIFQSIMYYTIMYVSRHGKYLIWSWPIIWSVKCIFTPPVSEFSKRKNCSNKSYCNSNDNKKKKSNDKKSM
jgi:hypothetical protein